jgi:methylenetetrahydrofolate dehydrogenase (NADP+)/methenyltetrahydrofolate cyclohydrolase
MTRVFDGKATAAEIKEDVAASVRELLASGGRQPCLVAVLVGGDAASQVYVGSKVKGCAEVGMGSRELRLPETTTEAELLAHVEELNADDTVDGILVQLPLPKQIDEKRILRAVTPDKDVDGFHPVNVGRLWLDEPSFAPATPSGIIELLRRTGTPLSGSRAAIVGRSTIVGKPMAGLLLRENCTVTICHSRTRDLPAVVREADLVVAAIGRPAFLTDEHVRPGAVVIDVGINRVTDPALVARLFPGDAARREQVAKRGSTLVGDVDYARVAPIASAITPVPGGVGPLTVAMVIANTLVAARRRQGAAPYSPRAARPSPS